MKLLLNFVTNRNQTFVQHRTNIAIEFQNLQTKLFLSISRSFKTLQRSSTEFKYTELHDTRVAIMDTQTDTLHSRYTFNGEANDVLK